MFQPAPRAPLALPVDMKNGMRNFPLSTRARRFCSVLPSKGRAPQTSTYRTTPRLCIHKDHTLASPQGRGAATEWGGEGRGEKKQQQAKAWERSKPRDKGLVQLPQQPQTNATAAQRHWFSILTPDSACIWASKTKAITVPKCSPFVWAAQPHCNKSL